MTVNVAAVEEELARIQWELTSSRVRTSLFNLVIWSPDAERTMADDALSFLLGKRAARVIHIVSQDVPESSLDVSARCFVDAERRGVCFQEIVITNGHDGAGAAPGSWVPLLVRDIPTFILWLDTICDKRDALSHAREQAEKLLVDSEHSIQLGDAEDRVFSALRDITVTQGTPVSDFTFKRLRPIQRLVAGAFDDPERTALLDHIAAVSVGGLTPPAARLFSLWMADRLGWRSTKQGFEDRRGHLIEFSRGAAPEDCETEIVMSTEGGETVGIRTRSAGCVDLDFPEGLERHGVVSFPDDGSLLLEEVDNVASDALYRAALSAMQYRPVLHIRS
jgi:glucose-6-phosphate dehydrogenase assembly protein OpcA